MSGAPDDIKIPQNIFFVFENAIPKLLVIVERHIGNFCSAKISETVSIFIHVSPH